MKKALLTLIFSYVLACSFGQTISSLNPSYGVADPKTFVYSGAPGNPTDWIGVYHVGELPDGDPPSVTWDYITGTSGQLVLNGQNQAEAFAAGDYAVHLFCCDGYQILASDTFSITGVAPAALASTTFPFVNDTVFFEYSGGTGSPTDWIGIYEKGAVPGSDLSLDFAYVSSTSGNIGVDIEGIPAGTYDAHLFCCDLYEILASTEITIYNQTPPSIAAVSQPVQNQPISFTYGGGSGSFQDWVGIYPHGETPDGDPPSISYLYVSAPNGQVDFDTIPELLPGNFYDAHLFCCNDYSIIASYENFSITPSSTNDIADHNLFYAVTQGGNVDVFFRENISGKINLFNTMGQLVANTEINNNNYLRFEGLAPNTYLLTLQTNQNNYTLKIGVK